MRNRRWKFALWACAFVFAFEARAIPSPVEISGVNLTNGKVIRVAARESSKGVVLVFLSARCPCSASHQERLKELSNEFESQGFRFVGVHSNSDEPVEMARKHFEESHLPFPILQDDGSKIANEYGALKTPHAFVLNPEGRVVFQGGVDDSHIAQTAKKHYLREALLAIAAGKEPPQKEVRALGCVIKRR
jgi:peroxiredoxin